MIHAVTDVAIPAFLVVALVIAAIYVAESALDLVYTWEATAIR